MLAQDDKRCQDDISLEGAYMSILTPHDGLMPLFRHGVNISARVIFKCCFTLLLKNAAARTQGYRKYPHFATLMTERASCQSGFLYVLCTIIISYTFITLPRRHYNSHFISRVSQLFHVKEIDI